MSSARPAGPTPDTAPARRDPALTTTHTLDVPDARLHYEVRGRGPLLLVLGSPMAAAMFAPLADAMAGERTVVTTDPRGIGASPLADPYQDSTPDRRAAGAS